MIASPSRVILLGLVASSILLLTGTASAKLAATPSTTITAPSSVNQVSTAGDLNGDGYSDLVVAHSGLVQVYLGSASGLHTGPDWQIVDPGGAANFGISATVAGDLNGDHIDDLVIGSTGNSSGIGGAVYVYFGGTDLASRPQGGTDYPPSWYVTADPNTSGLVNFGGAVSGAGDLNGDGVDDLVVAAPITGTT